MIKGSNLPHYLYLPGSHFLWHYICMYLIKMSNTMKGMSLKTSGLIALLMLLTVPVLSQGAIGSENITGGENNDCSRYLSVYREFFKIDLYEEAFEPWWKVFKECPESSEMMYIDGVTMYKSYIEAAPEGPEREGLIDTLMLIYDQRMEYFKGEGNVLGRKGRDLFTYRKTDIEQVRNAYDMLKKSIELEGQKSQEAVMLYFISAGVTLNKEDKIDDNQIIEDYFMVAGILDQLEGRSSRWKRTRETIDEIILKENILTCEALNRYFEPQFEQNKNDKDFLKKVISFYTSSECGRSDLYVAAAENLYQIEPGPASAHSLGILFIAKNDFEKAARYLKEAVLGVGVDNKTRADWFYELAIVSSANKDYCDAISYAREAIDLMSNLGKAYIALGDAMIASRENLGEDFEQRSAFWAAADQYTQAASVDPSVANEAKRKLADYASQYPNNEDVFFRDLKDGDPYQVGGCINEKTTVRSRK